MDKKLERKRERERERERERGKREREREREKANRHDQSKSYFVVLYQSRSVQIIGHTPNIGRG